MSNIHNLNQDLLHELFAYFTKPDLLAITSVCSGWHDAAQHHIDHTLDILATHRLQEANLRLLHRLSTDVALQSRVSAVEVLEWQLDPVSPMPKTSAGVISDPWHDGGYFSETYQNPVGTSDAAVLFLEVLTMALRSTNPRTFRWAALPGIPNALAEGLSQIQNCNVQICRNSYALETTVWSYYPLCNKQQVFRLSQAHRNLSVLELIVSPSDTALLKCLGSLIASTTQLKSLRIYAMGRLWSASNMPMHLLASNHRLFKPAESLTWLSDAVLSSGRKLRLECLELDNFCLCEHKHSFRLGSITDVTKLQELNVSCFSIVAGAGEVLQARSFRLLCALRRVQDMAPFCLRQWSDDEVRQFLLRCTKLKHLQVLNDRAILTEEVMEHLGPLLIDLQNYSTSSVWGHARETNFSPQQEPRVLPGLHRCTKLRSLALNAPVPFMEAFAPFARSYVEQLPILEYLTLFCSAEPKTSLARDESIPPDRTTIACASMPRLWQRVASSSRTLTELRLVFQHRKPWDRDPPTANRGRHYIPERSRTLLAVLMSPVCGDYKLDLESSCLDLTEAVAAERHGFAEPYVGYWTSRIAHLKTLATEETTLIVRGGPTAQYIAYNYRQ